MIKVGDLVRPAPGCEYIAELGTGRGTYRVRYGVVCGWVESSHMWEIIWNDGRETSWWNERELRILT